MKRHRLALLTAAMMLMTVLGAAPAVAGETSISWDTGRGGQELSGGENLIDGALLVLNEPVGAECTAYVTTENKPTSPHPGHILRVWLGDPAGDPLIELPEFENGGPTAGSAEFDATGENLVVTVFKGEDRRTSHNGTLTVTCDPPDNGGGEGCTPGYWKQEHHFDSWEARGYATSDDFDTVFGLAPGTTGDWTLLDGVSAKGGKQNAWARHGVAALLNSSNPDVSYEFSSLDVIDKVQAAFDSGNWNFYKDQLEYENEMGCPLN